MKRKILTLLVIGITLVLNLPTKQLLASHNADWRKLFEVQLSRAYQIAVKDARNAQENEISNKLLPITLDNPNLVWRNVKDKPQVLIVTWTSWDGYDDKVSQTMPLSQEVWVTAVPELQKFAAKLNLSEKSLTLRLEQYLGLPAHNGKTKFVQMWVNPKDLFRPCADPEINDTRCELSFPQQVQPTHLYWVFKKRFTSYGENGYPWTRLGYTYDWGSLDTEVGASEFVVKKGAEVEVESVTKTIKYVKDYKTSKKA
ncbi:hypothetical protein [Calothrix rhizosoleniae]|uniref:hypothetical protein n=1 Tax=Calothrix rhizosoleniae TaxID=888997 RepID=UPI000B49DECA|nr:hypothetical protein [Calothrix rhizosoleniae]